MHKRALCNLTIIFFFFLNKIFCNSFFIKDIFIEGNKIYSKEEIIEILQIKPNESYPVTYLKEKILELKKRYIDNGYTLINIDNVNFDLNSNLIIRIKEGKIANFYIRGVGINVTLTIRQKISESLTDDIFNKIKFEKLLDELKKDKAFKEINYDIISVDEKNENFNIYISIVHHKVIKSLFWEIQTYAGPTFKTSLGWQQKDFFGENTQYSIIGSLYWASSKINAQEYKFTFLIPISLIFQPFINLYYSTNGIGRKDLFLGFQQQYSIIETGFEMRFKHFFFISFKYNCIFPVYFSINLSNGDPKILFPDLYDYDKRFDKFNIDLKLTDRGFFNREDLRSQILFSTDFYIHKKHKSIIKFLLIGKKIFSFNYNYLVLETKMFYTINKPFILEEEPISGYYLKGYTSGLIYSTRAIQLSAEYRFSLYKDNIHICWVTQSSWFKELRNSGYDVRNSNLISFGPGFYFHFKEFIGYIYYNIGFREKADRGEYHFGFKKVF